MKKPHSQVAALNAHIATIEEGLQKLVDQRGDAYFQLQGSPSDSSLMARLHAIDEQLARSRAEAANLEGLRARAVEADGEHERVAERAAVDELIEEANGAARQRVKVWARIEAAITKLGPDIQLVTELGDIARSAAAKAAVRCIGNEAFLLRASEVLEPAVGNVGGAPEALAGLLLKSGVGVLIPSFRDMGSPSRASVADASAVDAARLEAGLDMMARQLCRAHAPADERVRVESERRMHRLGAIHTKEQLVAAPGAKD